MLDKCLKDSGGAPSRSDAGIPAALPARPFDFYVLALSWSPAFCDAGGAARSPDQCAAGSNLGFVVHGLWPQFTRGYPSNCDTGTRTPPRAAFEGVRDLYPDIGLARHEWRQHASCTGLSPTAYFAGVRQARDAVTVPEVLRRVDEPQTLDPRAIARAFMAANRGLRADTMAVTCQSGALREVRVCFARDLRGFAPCPEVARGACRAASVDVLPTR